MASNRYWQKDRISSFVNAGPKQIETRPKGRVGRFFLSLGAIFQFSNPQVNPQNAMSCTTSANLGSPRGLLSRCKA
jgi:hypothetical protein